MAANTRFSTGVHALVLLAADPSARQTSETIAARLGTNPVVIRRVFALLQQAELVISQKGPSGGSRLARPAREITLKDVHQALEQAPFFRSPALTGGAADGINKELTRAFKAAEASMLETLSETTLHSLAKRVAKKSV